MFLEMIDFPFIKHRHLLAQPLINQNPHKLLVHFPLCRIIKIQTRTYPQESLITDIGEVHNHSFFEGIESIALFEPVGEVYFGVLLEGDVVEVGRGGRLYGRLGGGGQGGRRGRGGRGGQV